MQTSTAVSDAVLAVVSYAAAISLLRLSRVLPAIGFLLQAVAASLGALKFGMQTPSANIITYHGHATWLASVVGISLIAGDYHLGNHYQSRHFSYIAILLFCAIPVVTLAKIFKFWSNKVDIYVTDAIGFTSILSIFLSSIIYPNSCCLFGSLMYVVAGLIGTQGTLCGYKKVDWFHYLLAFGNVSLVLAFKYKPEPIYFKNK